ncbi:MAG: RNA 2',3'-cyclic phosphodiesterase [Bacillati bacterium ANGP1]|uniref:RNA 2',3'-cyclic phosphodiesterase n=1 Tax=Candidatus Segetimicrobium genomatis TaxID=2569760 RepID=A0A537KXB5_9BACT|nr:MAG: RNA 2',3'-cyclic phosphodiesterase [Terrabacteria group bacterium ANGP1]
MSEGHRIFIAVELDSTLHQAVIDLQHQLEAAGARVRWNKPAQLHFTLRFIGAVTPAQVALVKVATREAVNEVTPFTIALRQLGAFPSLHRPQILWVGVEDGAAELQALAAKLETQLAHHRFPPEERPFRPHLTLARIRDERQWGDVVRALTQFRDFGVGSQRVQAVTVMESELTPRGPVYTRVEEVSLQGYEK